MPIKRTKYQIILFSLFFVGLSIPTKEADRIITEQDIARWYIDSDIVAKSSLIEKEIILIESVDTVNSKYKRVHYDIVKEQYLICVDSIIKGDINQDTFSIETQEYRTGYYEYEIFDSISFEISASGDTTYLNEMVATGWTDYTPSYFRIGNSEKQIVFLEQFGNTYRTVFISQDISVRMIDFLQKVDRLGEDYFDQRMKSITGSNNI